MKETAEVFGRPWRGLLSLACGLVAIFILFVARQWDAASLGEPAGAAFSLAVTWLPVVLPICGFGFGVLGIAQDRQKGIAIAATVVNGLGLMVAAFIIYILAG